MRRTLADSTERIEQEELHKQQKERIEQNDRMNITRELYVEELRVVAHQYASEAISEPEEEEVDSFDTGNEQVMRTLFHQSPSITRFTANRCYLQV